MAVVRVLLWTWVSDGVRWRPGELVCPGRFLSASEVTARCHSSQSSQDDVCRRAGFRYASPRVKGAVYPPGCICPEGHPFLTCTRVLYYPGEPCRGLKSERPDCTRLPVPLLPGQEEACGRQCLCFLGERKHLLGRGQCRGLN